MCAEAAVSTRPDLLKDEQKKRRKSERIGGSKKLCQK